MVDPATFVVIAATLITVLGVIVILVRRKLRGRSVTETNYRALFNVGIIFICVGLAISIGSKMINPLLLLGVIYTIIGIANKDQWQPMS